MSDSHRSDPVYRRRAHVAFVVEPVPGEPDGAPAAGGSAAGEPAEQAVLLHLPSGRRTVLSPAATAIWQRLAAAEAPGVRPGDIATDLATQFDAKPTVIEHDVRQLLEELVSADLAERVDAAPPAAE